MDFNRESFMTKWPVGLKLVWSLYDLNNDFKEKEMVPAVEGGPDENKFSS